MKPVRVLLIGTLVLTTLLLTAAVIALSPGVQTWAARRALAGRPGLDISLGRVSARPGRVRLENVRVVQAGAVLVLPAAEVELPLFPAALRHKVLVHRLVARGWTLDLTHADAMPAAPPEASPRPPVISAGDVAAAPVAVFAGILNQLKLPVDLELDGVELAGDVLLPAQPDHPAARAKLTIAGGHLSAARAGMFDYTATIMFEGIEVAVRSLVIHGTLGAEMETPRALSRLVAATEAEATGPKFPGGVKLTVNFSVARTAAGESYAMAVSSGLKQLAAVETSYPAGASHLAGTWRLDMHDTDLAPFAFGRELPLFEAAGEGSFAIDAGFAELHASGRLNATADRLAAIKPAFAALGPVQLEADFDVARRGEATRVDRLAVTVAGAKPVATVRALQAFEFNLKTGELNVADPAKDLVGIVFQGLPLAWVSPFLGKTGIVLAGSELQGEFVASARNGGFALRPKSPLTMGNLTVALAGGRTLLRAVDIALTASADYAPQGWQLELAPLTVSSGGATLFALEAKAGQLAGREQPVKAAGTWTAQLPALLAQPVAAGFAELTGGNAQGSFVASLGVKQEIQARLALANLVAAAGVTLPAVAADLRADVDRSGRITFNVPFIFEREGRKSDLTLAGTLAPNAGGLTVDTRLTSELLMVDDVKAIALPIGAPAILAVPAVAATSEAPARPPVPFWSGVSGQCVLALKKVLYGDQFQVTDVTGVLRIDTGTLKMVDGRGGFGADSDVRLAGGVMFHPAATQPYELAADFALNNFDTTPAFRAINPAKTPTVEARINLTSKLTAAGASLTDLADRAHGELLITSKGGIFRGLSADLADRIQKTQSRVTAIASFLGVVPDDYVNKTRILSDIAKALSEIPFDQLSVTAARDPSLNLQLKDFTLISPEVRIGGGGEVRHVEGVPVLAQPMEVQLNLGARGRLGDLIKRAGLLEAHRDALGYAAFSVPLKIGGTLGNPDTNEIRNALLNSALERSGLLDSLLGK